MSLYSCLHFVSKADENWLPSNDDILNIFEYSSTNTITLFSAYNKGLDWNDELNECNPFFEESDINVDKVMKLYNNIRCTANCKAFRFSSLFNRYAMNFIDNSTIFSNISGDYAVTDFGLELGESNIPNITFDGEQGTFAFQLVLSGPGMPIEIDTFLESVMYSDNGKHLIKFLERMSNRKFELLFSTY
ncbi:MAG TPA: hypothetical protein VGL77_04915 [Armatimonadota bacterium]|jgi:hypothetical protein